MSPLPNVPPELVLFDVDGTLHDTFQWWGRVIRAGVAAFGGQIGVELPVPDDVTANAVVGMKDEGVWGPFLPEELRHRWAELREVVIPMEIAVLRQADYLFPGIRDLLRDLRARGCRIALASNCRQRYMEGVRDGQGLAPLIDAFYCLDSNGGSTKTEMLGLACEEFGTRKAVMVGDREPDHEAAVAQALPFVWRRNDRCRIDDADAVWGGDPAELLGILGLDRIS